MITVLRPERIASSVPKRYPAEFRPQGPRPGCSGPRPIAQVAADLDISDQAIYVWRRQELIDTGQLPGTTSTPAAVSAISTTSPFDSIVFQPNVSRRAIADRIRVLKSI
jgi:transposase-like protein